jgi:hypothetical protein
MKNDEWFIPGVSWCLNVFMVPKNFALICVMVAEFF